ncbi:MAG: MinD/ParA family protein [Clostridia bacterium]|nr:MinD/ParA family protein [Clostridia bacterium]
MLDQASKLRELVVKDKMHKKVTIPSFRTIAVVSGKGGVGKTNLTLNLAIALAQLGKKVMILDADLGMANVDILLGLVTQYNLLSVLKGHKSLTEIIVEGPSGIKIIPGGSGFGEIASIDKQQQESLWEQLKNICKDIDYLFIDCGAGISRTILGFISAADDVLVVLTPEPTSITDAYSVIKVLSRFEINSQVLLAVNKVSSLKEANVTANKIETVSNRFLNIKIKRLGYISKDHHVEKAVCSQVPFTMLSPRCKASDDIKQLAINLIEGKMKPPKGIDNFIGRLFRLFE